MQNYKSPGTLWARFGQGLLGAYVSTTEQERRQRYDQQLLAQRGEQARALEEQNAGNQIKYLQEQGRINAENQASAAGNKPGPTHPFDYTAEGYEEKLRLDQKYGKGKGSNEKDKDFNDYMNEAQNEYPDATPAWQRGYAGALAATGGNRDQAASSVGPMEKKKKPHDEVRSEAMAIIRGWQTFDTNVTKKARRESPEAGEVERPLYGGVPLPPVKEMEVAEAMSLDDLDQQDAANQVYAEELSNQLADELDISDPGRETFHVDALQAAAQFSGKQLPKFRGDKVSLDTLAALSAFGWAADEIRGLIRGASYQTNIRNAVRPGPVK